MYTHPEGWQPAGPLQPAERLLRGRPAGGATDK